MKTILRKKLLGMIPAVVGIALVTTSCTQGVPAETVAAKDREIADLKAQLTAIQQDSTFWQQLITIFPPLKSVAMSDHRAYMLPGGAILALHFDNMNLPQAKNLNWVALGVPGKFCKEDQERIEKQFGKGFTHFHDMVADTHGGSPGAEGMWFIHSGVREFLAPWGPVKPGVAQNFMPTQAPRCGS